MMTTKRQTRTKWRTQSRQVEQRAQPALSLVHCNTPALVGAPANSRTGTEPMLSGVHWAPRCWRRRNRARWHDSVTFRHNTGAHRGAGGIAHRHRKLHSVAFKRRLPAATREAAAGTVKQVKNSEAIHRTAIRIWNEIPKKVWDQAGAARPVTRYSARRARAAVNRETRWKRTKTVREIKHKRALGGAVFIIHF